MAGVDTSVLDPDRDFQVRIAGLLRHLLATDGESRVFEGSVRQPVAELPLRSALGLRMSVSDLKAFLIFDFIPTLCKSRWEVVVSGDVLFIEFLRPGGRQAAARGGFPSQNIRDCLSALLAGEVSIENRVDFIHKWRYVDRIAAVKD